MKSRLGKIENRRKLDDRRQGEQPELRRASAPTDGDTPDDDHPVLKRDGSKN